MFVGHIHQVVGECRVVVVGEATWREVADENIDVGSWETCFTVNAEIFWRRRSTAKACYRRQSTSHFGVEEEGVSHKNSQ